MGQHFTLGAGPVQIMGQHAAPAVWLSPPMLARPASWFNGNKHAV